MNPTIHTSINPGPLARGAATLALALTCALAALSQVALPLKAQDIYVGTAGNTIGEYGSDGSTINASLISGLSTPEGIAISGNDLFVANWGNGTVGEYTLSGATVDASLISGAGTYNPIVIAISGNDIFVANQSVGTIGEYTTSGATVDASLVSGLGGVIAIAISGNDLFVLSLSGPQPDEISDFTLSGQLIGGFSVPPHSQSLAVSGNDVFVTGQPNYVGEYTTTGQTVYDALITELDYPDGIASSGDDLFVVNSDGTIGEYTTSGATVNASLITAPVQLTGIAISPAPEPSTIALAGLGAVALCLCQWRCHRSRRLAKASP